MFYLQENRPAYLLSGIVFRDGKTTDFNCRIFLAPFGVGDAAVKTVPQFLLIGVKNNLVV